MRNLLGVKNFLQDKMLSKLAPCLLLLFLHQFNCGQLVQRIVIIYKRSADIKP